MYGQSQCDRKKKFFAGEPGLIKRESLVRVSLYCHHQITSICLSCMYEADFPIHPKKPVSFWKVIMIKSRHYDIVR